MTDSFYRKPHPTWVTLKSCSPKTLYSPKRQPHQRGLFPAEKTGTAQMTVQNQHHRLEMVGT